MLNRPCTGLCKHCSRLLPSLVIMVCVFSSGCDSSPGRYRHIQSRRELRQSSPEVEFEYGKAHFYPDRIQKLAELPHRIFGRGRSLRTRQPTEATREALTDYLQQNNLTQVPVLVCEYDPAGEWKRLQNNHHISAGWRYTVGVLTVANSTVFPGRAFGRTQYNPFTNSLSVNSDRLSDALREAACAKDILGQDHPGTYAALNSVPGLALWKSTRAVQDVLDYAQATDHWQLERAVYRDQFPEVAMETTLPAGFFMSPVANLALTMGGGAVGYAVGRTAEYRRLATRDKDVVAASHKTPTETETRLERAGHAVLAD